MRRLLLKLGAVLLVLLAGTVAAVVYFTTTRNDRASAPAPVPPNAAVLESQLEAAEKEAEDATYRYETTEARGLDFLGGNIEKLAAPAAEILRKLPGVVAVDVAVEGVLRAQKPTHRIIHLLDLHHVPRDLYGLDMQIARPEDVAEAHRLLLAKVELVQVEQAALLRCLAVRHDLKRVLCEGLTAEGEASFRLQVKSLSNATYIDRHLQQNVAEASGLKSPNAKQTVDEARKLLAQHRADYRESFLAAGAAVRLLVDRDLKQVLPLDDEAALDAARPIAANGRMRIDPAKTEARHEGQVRAAMASGPVSVIILGGAHDLTAAVQKIGGWRVQYLRVTTARYREFVPNPASK
jgi:hypothetical protein